MEKHLASASFVYPHRASPGLPIVSDAAVRAERNVVSNRTAAQLEHCNRGGVAFGTQRGNDLGLGPSPTRGAELDEVVVKQFGDDHALRPHLWIEKPKLEGARFFGEIRVHCRIVACCQALDGNGGADRLAKTPAGYAEVLRVAHPGSWVKSGRW